MKNKSETPILDIVFIIFLLSVLIIIINIITVDHVKKDFEDKISLENVYKKDLEDKIALENIYFEVLSSRDHVYNFYRILDDLDKIEPGLSKKFINNVKNDMKNPPDYNPEFILILSFDFSETPEGKDYWKNVGNKLLENLENYNDKN